MPEPVVLAIDQGTSATKAVLVGTSGAVIARASAPVSRSTPKPGWIEQSADELWHSCQVAVKTCLDDVEADVVAVGLSNQRESLVLWDRATGAARSPVISWQDQRSAATCEEFVEAGHGELVRSVSGLPLDPMFSSTKAKWLLDSYDPSRQHSGRGHLCLGTIDSWLLFQLTGTHLVEAGNASRTQLLDVRTGDWSESLLDLFGVPRSTLPDVVSSTGPFPAVRGLNPLPEGTPLAAVLGDSHAALFAHAGLRRGVVKATFGTGSSVMAVVDDDTDPDSADICRTIAWQRGTPVRALEGNIRSTGDTLVWLGALLGLDPAAIAELGQDTGSEGVHIVPAFNGLGAPWWDRDAIGLISGLTSGTRNQHLARAALESIAFQIEDVVAAIERGTGPIELLLADGGPSGNAFLMQLQADTSGRRVRSSLTSDLSALGAAHLAGHSVGLWSDEELERLPRPGVEYAPVESAASRRGRFAAWHDAVARSRHVS